MEQEERVWSPEEAVQKVERGGSKRSFLVGTAGKGPVYMTVKEVEAVVYADVINVEPLGVAVTHQRRERVLYFDTDVRRAVYCIRDLSADTELDVLTRYTDVVPVGDRDHHYLKEGGMEGLVEEADRRILAEYRNAAMKVEKIAEMLDNGMAPVLMECAEDIRAAMDTDRRFRG